MFSFKGLLLEEGFAVYRLSLFIVFRLLFSLVLNLLQSLSSLEQYIYRDTKRDEKRRKRVRLLKR